MEDYTKETTGIIQLAAERAYPNDKSSREAFVRGCLLMTDIFAPFVDNSDTTECAAGCKKFTGGEIRHDKNCIYYEESFTQMYDKLEQRYNKTVEALMLLSATETIVDPETRKVALDAAKKILNGG